MAQAVLTKVSKNDKGEIILTFSDLNHEVRTGKYTGKLTEEQLQELTGTQIAFTGKLTVEEKEDIGTITRAWDGAQPVYADSEFADAGDDRGDSIR